MNECTMCYTEKKHVHSTQYKFKKKISTETYQCTYTTRYLHITLSEILGAVFLFLLLLSNSSNTPYIIM